MEKRPARDKFQLVGTSGLSLKAAGISLITLGSGFLEKKLFGGAHFFFFFWGGTPAHTPLNLPSQKCLEAFAWLILCVPWPALLLCSLSFLGGTKGNPYLYNSCYGLAKSVLFAAYPEKQPDPNSKSKSNTVVQLIRHPHRRVAWISRDTAKGAASVPKISLAQREVQLFYFSSARLPLVFRGSFCELQRELSFWSAAGSSRKAFVDVRQGVHFGVRASTDSPEGSMGADQRVLYMGPLKS